MVNDRQVKVLPCLAHSRACSHRSAHAHSRKNTGIGRSWGAYSAVSQHLAILRAAGLVESRRKGRHQLYRLEPGPLSEVHAWAGRYERFWRNRLGRLKRLVEAPR